MELQQTNPLSTAPIGKLMVKYAVPSVVSLVVNALYNIVDQIFIGWGVGTLGNSATNVIFPLSVIVVALSLLLGDGGAAYLSLESGRNNREKAQKGVNCTILWLIIVAVIVFVLCFIFLEPVTSVLGSTPDNKPYVLSYGRIIVIGFPFAIVGSGLSSIIRSDGSPHITMIGMIAGCITNVILDAVFVLGFKWGMEGAAIATVIGQLLNLIITLCYIPHFKTVKITVKEMKLDFKMLAKISSLGISSFVSQFAVAVVTAVTNYYLVRYGAMTKYGSDIPMAAFGIVMKFNTILVSIVTGIGTGSQPIIGYNYGSSDFKRVKKTFFVACRAATIVAVICFIIFQVFPKQLTAIFGSQGELYTEFSIMAFRTFSLLCFVDGFQIVSAIFFQSIGKALISGIISFSRQIIFLIPAIMILCPIIGLKGVVLAGPVADGLAFILALILVIYEVKNLNRLEQKSLKEKSK